MDAKDIPGLNQIKDTLRQYNGAISHQSQRISDLEKDLGKQIADQAALKRDFEQFQKLTDKISDELRETYKLLKKTAELNEKLQKEIKELKALHDN